jgi:hypothetical protein
MNEIKALNKYVNRYYSTNREDGHELNELLQKISALLFYLVTIKSELHDDYENTVFELVKEKYSVARAVNHANVKHPLLYQLRQSIDAGNRILDAIRTNISFLKSEKINSNSQV